LHHLFLYHLQEVGRLFLRRMHDQHPLLWRRQRDGRAPEARLLIATAGLASTLKRFGCRSTVPLMLLAGM